MLPGLTFDVILRLNMMMPDNGNKGILIVLKESALECFCDRFSAYKLYWITRMEEVLQIQCL